MSDRGEIGVVDSCKRCFAVKWAGYSDLCPKCAERQKWEKSPDGYVTLTKSPKEKK